MEKLKFLIINSHTEIVDMRLKILKDKGYVEIIDLDKKDYERIKRIEQKEVHQKKQEIINLLNLMGMPQKMIGYDYIISAVIYIYNNKNLQDDIFIKDIYKELSKKYNKTIYSIEKAIRKVIEATFTFGNVDEIYKIFEDSVSKNSGSMSNKKFIYVLARKLYDVIIK